MIIEVVRSGPVSTNAYLIGCDKEKVAFIIDPAVGSADKLLAIAQEKGLAIKAIYLTHSHWDHFADAAKLKRLLPDIPLICHPNAKANLIAPGSDRIPMIGKIESVEPDRYIHDGDIGVLGQLTFRVIHTPGHSPCCVCFYFEKEKILISGDTLFKGTCGSTAFPTSSERDMTESLKKLFHLPDDVVVYPGHMGPTTIGAERPLY